MKFTQEAVFPQDRKTMFEVVTDLENAPLWHSVHERMVQTTPGPVGPETRWKIVYKTGQEQSVWITDWVPDECVRFQGANLGGVAPVFIVRFDEIETGTRVEYTVQPILHPLIKLPVSMFAPYFGKRDLRRYFEALGEILNNSEKPNLLKI